MINLFCFASEWMKIWAVMQTQMHLQTFFRQAVEMALIINNVQERGLSRHARTLVSLTNSHVVLINTRDSRA